MTRSIFWAYFVGAFFDWSYFSGYFPWSWK